jgi:hypothetical protein
VQIFESSRDTLDTKTKAQIKDHELPKLIIHLKYTIWNKAKKDQRNQVLNQGVDRVRIPVGEEY